jgi:hypothetical protein
MRLRHWRRSRSRASHWSKHCISISPDHRLSLSQRWCWSHRLRPTRSAAVAGTTASAGVRARAPGDRFCATCGNSPNIARETGA